MTNRIPIRRRLALAFAGMMGLVLVITGLFLYLQLRSELDAQISRELAARQAGALAIVADDGDDVGDPRSDPLDRVDEGGLVQVFDDDAALVGATSEALLTEPMLPVEELQSLGRGRRASVDAEAGPLGEELRVTAAPARDDGRDYLVVTAASLAQRNETLSNLTRLLFIGGPFALILASLAAHGVVTAALRPVESMRARARRISAAEPGGRLPVSPADDEIASLGRTLNEMLARLEVAFERERAFVANASHELRTPLAILKAELDLALASGQSREELQAAVISAAEETDRLASLAEDLLVLARADEGRLPVHLEHVDLDALSQRVAVRFAVRAAEDGRSVRVARADLSVDGDAARLDQALSNLVDNALRYGAGKVTISSHTASDWVELSVRDEGAGFASGLLGRAFERFTRADAAGARAGAGLGLAIVAVIAEAHGGSVRAQNGSAGAEVIVRIATGP